MVSRDYLPNVGGIAAHVHELSKVFVMKGHRIHVVVAGYGETGVTEEVIDGVRIHRVRTKGDIRAWRFLELLSLTRNYLTGLIQEHGVDIVHWHQLRSSSLESKWIGKLVPRVFTNHSSEFLELVEKPLGRLFLRWLIGHADHVIAPSQELVEKTTWTGYPRSRVSYVPNGVDPMRFNPNVNGSVIREKHSIDDDTLIVLCPRRLAPKNGVVYAVNAMQLLPARPKSILLVVGGGYPKERKRIEREIATGSEDSVRLVGPVPNDEMPLYFAAADIVVIPSLREAVSIAGLEAMASARPLIGTEVGGLPAIIDRGKTGLLVPARNPAALARAISSLARCPDDRVRMGTAARNKALADFTWDVVADRTLRVYNEVISGGH